MRVFSNVADATTLDGAVGSTDTSIDIGSAAGWPVPDSGEEAGATIGHEEPSGSDREHITYTGITGNTLTGVSRGQDGTTAQAHPSGKSIVHAVSADDVGNGASVEDPWTSERDVDLTYDGDDISEVEYRDDSETLVAKDSLAYTDGDLTEVVREFFESDGVTVRRTVTSTLTYDAAGNVESVDRVVS